MKLKSNRSPKIKNTKKKWGQCHSSCHERHGSAANQDIHPHERHGTNPPYVEGRGVGQATRKQISQRCDAYPLYFEGRSTDHVSVQSKYAAP